MAAIRESLVLEDQFSASLKNYIKLMEQSETSTKEQTAAAKAAKQAAQVYSSALRTQAAQSRAVVAQSKAQVSQARAEAAQARTAEAQLRKKTAAIKAETAAARLAAQQARAAAKAQNGYNRSMQEGTDKASRLTGTLGKLAGAYGGIQGLKALAGLSDQMTQTTARLDMMNDGLQTTKELNAMIFQSANRSRGAYQATADMVAKLGTLAGNAFSSNKEIVAFAEQLNKQMTISGTNTTGRQAAMLQLTQAMSSGVLRGEELNSILEQTPMIAQSIADYMGVTTGEMRKLASEGKVTADVVKNAMFAAAEETDAKFAQMPMTWAQVWTLFQNYAQIGLKPVLLGLSWLANHIKIIGPLVLGAATAFAAFQIAAHWVEISGAAMKAYKFTVDLVSASYLLLTRQISAAEAAQLLFNTAVYANPLSWLLMGILLVVGALYAGVAAYNHFADASVSATGIVAGAFSVLGAFIWNHIVLLYNGFAAFANFIGNVFNDPATAIKVLFWDLAVTVLGYLSNVVHGIQDLVNMIPTVELNLTSGIDAMLSAASGKSQAVKSASGWKEYVSPMEYKSYKDAFSSGYKKGANFSPYGGTSNPLDYSSMLGDMGGSLADIGKDVGSIKKSVNMADEDVKMLVDVATGRYVNKINLTAQSPVITVQGQNTGNTEADRRALADAIRDLLLEQSAAASYRSTAMPT